MITAYLDNAATTRPCNQAIAAMVESMKEGYFNPSSLYAPAIKIEKQIDAVRAQILSQLCAKKDDKVLFTSGGTEANNLALIGSLSAMRGSQHVITSATEHSSVRTTASLLEKQNHTVTFLSPDMFGAINYDELAKELRDNPPALVSLMQVNNETGAVLDVKKLSDMVKILAPSALIHVDGVQGFMKLPMDMRHVDMYSLSGHKIHAPKGIGALVLSKRARILARQFGGSQQQGLRPGTENVPGIIGLGAAIAHMANIPDLRESLLAKKIRLFEAVQKAIPEAKVMGPAIDQGAPHIINIALPDVRAEVMLHALEGDHVYCSTGSACSSKKQMVSPILVAMGINPNIAEGALRFSFCSETTDTEIDYAAECTAKQHAVLRRFQRR